jgi:hypothetical protein
MRIRTACLIALCVVGLAASPPRRRSASPHPHVSGTVIPKDAQPTLEPRMAVTGLVAPAWDVTVDWSLQLADQDATLYRQMATNIGADADIPADRTNYYSMVVNQPGFAVNGWTGMVNSVVADGNGGYLVTVSVFPLLSSDQYGTPTQIASDYSERSVVAGDGTVTYLGFLDPQGLAGQPAALVR